MTRLLVEKLIEKVLEEKKLRVFVVRIALFSMLFVFCITLPIFMFVEHDPWVGFGKVLLLTGFSFVVGMFSAILGELFKIKDELEKKDGGAQGRADREVSASG